MIVILMSVESTAHEDALNRKIGSRIPWNLTNGSLRRIVQCNAEIKPHRTFVRAIEAIEASDSEGDEARTRRGGPSFELANESGFCVLQRVDGSLASDGGKILEKLI